MVNILENSTTEPQTPFLFSLSRPVNLFDEQFQKTKDFILKLNPSNSMFEFLEPFESSHAKNQSNQSGKITHKNFHTRSKPYSRSHTSEKSDSSILSLSSSSSNSSNGSNYHQTAILARLSSISSTFKSIFVRPKNSKQVDIETIKQKPTVSKPEFKLRIFSTNDDLSHQTEINTKIEKILSQNIIDSKPSNFSSGSSVVSTLSTTSNLTSDSFLTPIEKPVLKSNPGINSKWTCMVCLSKHKMDVKVCVICGSFKQNTKTKTPAPGPSPALKTINSNLNPSNYVKTWTCSFCSFANDSLKIVCMNCRSSKQMQQQHQNKQQNKKEQVLLHQSIQAKRARKESESKKSLNTSNEENEIIEETEIKKTKKETVLETNNRSDVKPCSCKCKKIEEDKPDDTSLNLMRPVLDNLNHSKLVTPTKPPNFYNNTATTNSITNTSTITSTSNSDSLAKLIQSDKWSCSVCLVKNDADKNVCICCMTARESEKPIAKKWTCSTCLVSNEADKDTCVCCMTSKETINSKPATKTKFSELVALASSINPLSSVNTNISFGMKSSETSKPIEFGSSFSVKQNVSTLGFSFASKQNQVNKNEHNENKIEQVEKKSFENVDGAISEAKSTENVKQSNFETQIKRNSIFDQSTEIPKANLEAMQEIKPNSLFSFGNPIGSSKPGVSFGSTLTETPKFGSKNTESAAFSFESNTLTDKPLFNIKKIESESAIPKVISFGSNVPTTNTEKTTAFVFGSSNTTEQTKPVFGFDSSNTTEQTKPVTEQTTEQLNKQTRSAFDFGPASSEKSPLNFGETIKSTASFLSTAPSIGTNQSLFGVLNSEPSKPTPSFGSNNPLTTGTSKPLFGGITNSEAAKPAFLFGSTPASMTSSIDKSIFASSNSEPNKSTFSFGSNSAQSNNEKIFAFVVSNPEPIKPSFAFGLSNPEKPSFGFSGSNSEAPKPFGFGSGNNTNELPKPSFNFGSSANVEQSKSSFSFGGVKSEKVLETPKPFNFNTLNNSSFNFGSNATTSSNPFDVCSTPTSKNPFSTNSTATPSNSNFVFGSLNNQQNSPSLTQVLSAQTTPSARVIKKPTRRIKK